MKNNLAMLLAAGLLLLGSARAQQLTHAEYFFDTDPGTGNGSPLSVTAADTLVFNGTVSAAGLADGFHFLHIRAKDSNGRWSLTERRVFFVQTIMPSGPLADAEYFFDMDPGPGNGTALSVTGGDTITFAGMLSAGALSAGFHFLHIRTRSSGGRWSLAERRVFYIEPVTAVPILTGAEYFVDTDPGFGNATPIAVTPGDTLDFTGALAIATTDTGTHVLYIRAVDASNRWSLYEPRNFLISLSAAVNSIPHASQAGLYQNYPNPFSRTTTVEYYLRKPGDVTFYIMDFLGRVVKEIHCPGTTPGMHSIVFDHSLLSEGHYFYKMVAGDFVETKRMILVN